MHGSVPEVGDPVEFSVTGTCVAKEGDNFRVSLETANGKDLPQDEGPSDEPDPSESTDDMEQNLRRMMGS
jgi:hypothetical protein